MCEIISGNKNSLIFKELSILNLYIKFYTRDFSLTGKN